MSTFQFFHITDFCDVHFHLYDMFSYSGLFSLARFTKVKFSSQRSLGSSVSSSLHTSYVLPNDVPEEL